MKKAILIGATGLIGTELIRQLSDNSNYSVVVIIARKKIENLTSKFKFIQVDFDRLENYKTELNGDVLFSVLGTTIKKAGTKETQYKIDFGYQYNMAKMASDNGVKKLVLLSSAGANAKSSIFYSKMKGELDEAVQKLNFESVSIIRPSMLTGNRAEFRCTEKIFTPVMQILNIIPGARKYRPIKDVTVASAMIHAVDKNKSPYAVYELNDVFKLAK